MTKMRLNRFRLWHDHLPGNHFVLGDSAYIGFHDKCLLTLHRNPHGPQERDFNIRASKIRSKVENVIMLLEHKNANGDFLWRKKTEF